MMKNKVKKILLGLGIIAVIVSVSAVYYVRQQYVVPILMYHYIDHRDKESKLHVSPESFERQMHFLRKNKYNVIPL